MPALRWDLEQQRTSDLQEMRCRAPVSERAGVSSLREAAGKKEQEYCRDCESKSHDFERGFAPFTYRDRVQDSMMRFKYGSRAEYARFYAAAIAGCGKELLRHWNPDVLIPVPIHRERLLKRGYNQAEELAVRLSVLSGIPAERHAVMRVKNTRAQKDLNKLERKKNLEQAFTVARGFCSPKCVLLIDDIYTTGSTVDALAALLKKNGAQTVYFACACISPGNT